MVFVMLGASGLLIDWWAVRKLELWRASRAWGLHEGVSTWLLMYNTLHKQGLKCRIRHRRGSRDV